MSVEPQPALQAVHRPVARQGVLALPGRILGRLPQREGAFWVLFALATPKVLGPVFTIGLRRFLGPGASGLFDLASTPYKFLDNFRNFGTGPALVFERTVSRQVANTAWTLNMLFAVVITLVAQILAHPVAVYYDRPEVEPVFRILSIGYIFASVSSVHSFLLLRDLDFRARSVPPIGQVVVAGDLAVIFAAWGFGVGALVARELGSVVLGAVLLWAVYPFRPRVELVPTLAWKLFRYGAWVGLGLTVLFMSQNVDVFIGGHVIKSTKDIGFYTTSWKLAFIAASVFTLVASSMVFPTLSRLQDDIGSLRKKLLKAITQLGLVMFPAAAILAALAPVLIVPLLGSKWEQYRDSFLVLSLLAVYAGNRTMLSIFFEGYKAIGRPWIVPAYNGVKLAVMIPVMIFGARHGILGLALMYIPVQAIELPAALLLADKVLKVSPREVWRAASAPILSTLVMSGVAIAVEIGLKRGAGFGDFPTLLVALAAAGLAYLGSLLILDRSIFREGLGVLTKGL